MVRHLDDVEVLEIDAFAGVKVVIPPSFLDALKSHPALSFKASIDNVCGSPLHLLTKLTRPGHAN